MARYRTIKPEFWTSAQVMDLSLVARLMFIGMWNFADDEGRMALSPKTIKAQVFPSDDMSVEIIRRMIDELSATGLIRIYTADDKELLQITGWHHQKIDKARPSKFPPPPIPVADESSNVRRTVAPEREKGVEGKGEKEKDADASASHSIDPSISISPEVDLFRRGKEILGDRGGGLIKKLVDAKQGNIALARSAIEQASTKQDPREYIGAIIKSRDSPEDLRARGEAW